MKTKATVIVEMSTDGTYAAYMVDDMPGFGLAGYGDTAKEAVEDFYLSLKEIRQILQEKGKQMPDLEFDFHYDLKSFFSYFSYLNISKIGEKSGISASLMRQYVSGAAHASQKQYDKIRRTISEVVRELSMASI